uniref:Peptidase C1A papain C-terminal domain-containing protein n=1 Tax=Ditylenchus dipsaci TaxID=166011 RepID=A0A915EN76_9BILA
MWEQEPETASAGNAGQGGVVPILSAASATTERVLLRHKVVGQMQAAGGKMLKKSSSTSKRVPLSMVQAAQMIGGLYGISGGLKWTSTASSMDFYGISGGLLRRLRWSSITAQMEFYGSQVEFCSDLGQLIWHLRWTHAASHVSFTEYQVEFTTSRLDFFTDYVDSYGISGGLRWTFSATQVNLYGTQLDVAASQVEFYSISGNFSSDSGGLMWHLRTSSTSQVDFAGILGGLLRHLRCAALAIHVVGGRTSETSQVDFFLPIRVDIYGIIGGLLQRLRWTSAASEVVIYSISGEISGDFFYLGGHLQHLWVDFCADSGRLRRTFTASLVDLCGYSFLLRWTSTASLVDFYQVSNGRLRHLRWTSLASLVNFRADSGGLNWTSTASLVDFCGDSGGLRWTSTATEVLLHGTSADLLQRLCCGLKLTSNSTQPQVELYCNLGGLLRYHCPTHVVFHGSSGGFFIFRKVPKGNKTAAFTHLKMKKSFNGLAHASTDAAFQQGFKFLHDSAAGIEDFLLEMSDFSKRQWLIRILTALLDRRAFKLQIQLTRLHVMICSVLFEKSPNSATQNTINKLGYEPHSHLDRKFHQQLVADVNSNPKAKWKAVYNNSHPELVTLKWQKKRSNRNVCGHRRTDKIFDLSKNMSLPREFDASRNGQPVSPCIEWLTKVAVAHVVLSPLRRLSRNGVGTFLICALERAWSGHRAGYGSYEGCKPYEKSPSCGSPCSIDTYNGKQGVYDVCWSNCQPLYDKTYQQDLNKAKKVYWVKPNLLNNVIYSKTMNQMAEMLKNNNVDYQTLIKRELMLNGPMIACFVVYDEFQHYKSGIYESLTSTHTKELYGHCAKLIGWGEESGTPYWTYMNTWAALGEKTDSSVSL